MKALMLKLEPVIWLLFGAGMMVGGFILPAFIATVGLGLPSEEGFPHRGWVDFTNNKVDPQTGTLSVRAVFPNPKPERGPRFLTPGQFVRIRLPVAPPTPRGVLKYGLSFTPAKAAPCRKKVSALRRVSPFSP